MAICRAALPCRPAAHPLPPPPTTRACRPCRTSDARQVEKAVKTRRAKLVLLAPNVASIQHPAPPAAAAATAAAAAAEPAAGAAAGGGAEGGDEAAAEEGAECPAAALAALAREREVPLVFALSRQRMGKVRVECG